MPHPTSQNPSDAALVRQAIQGDKKAFVQIVARYQGLVSAVTLAIIKDPSASEDVAQDVFLNSWKKLSSLREPSKLRPWLVAIARQHALAALRKKRSDVTFDEQMYHTKSSAPQPDELSSQRDEHAFVFRALADLPEKYRLPLVLYYREEQSTARVASALSISPDAVRQRLSRGRQLLRDRVENSLSETLRRNAPTQAFTLAVATGIGLAKPTSASAATLAVKSVTPTASGPSSAVSMMTAAKKSSLAVAAAITLCSIPAGYGLGKLTSRYSSREAPLPTAPVTSPTTSGRTELHLSTLDSPTLALWRQLHATHGNGPEAMPLIWADIKAMPDGFSREALREALSAEWAQADPSSGYGKGLGFSFVDNWIKSDPEGAIEWIQTNDKKPEEVLTQHLSQIARSAPQLLVPLLEEIPKNNYSGGRVRQAFDIVAATDPIGLLNSALEMKSYAREQALSAAAYGWAKIDPSAAFSWAKKQKNDVRLIADTLRAWTQTDPRAALDALADDYRLHDYQSVIQDAAETDLVATITWLGQHPEILEKNSQLLSGTTWKQLSHDPVAYLNLLQKSGLEDLIPSLLHGGYSEEENISLRWREMAEWINNQKPSPAMVALQKRLANDLARKAPEDAFTFIATLPEGKAREEAIRAATFRLLDHGDLISNANELSLTQPEWATSIYQTALDKLRPNNFSQPEKWIQAIELLSRNDEGSRPGLSRFAQAWVPNDPDAATEYFLNREATGSNAFYYGLDAWNRENPPAFQDWANSLPPGKTREYVSPFLIREDFENAHEDERTWALIENISNPNLLQTTAREMSRRIENATQLEDLIKRIRLSPLSSQRKEELTHILEQKF